MTMPGIETLLRQPEAQAVAWALLQFVWQGAAVGALTAVALFALRRSASDVRYVVASIGLALMLTLPVVTGVQKYDALTSEPAAVAMPPALAASNDQAVRRSIEQPSGLSRCDGAAPTPVPPPTIAD